MIEVSMIWYLVSIIFVLFYICGLVKADKRDVIYIGGLFILIGKLTKIIEILN